LGYVIKFCRTLKNRVKNPSNPSTSTTSSIFLTESEIKQSKDYFFKKSAQELKHFIPSKKYRDITTEKNGILIYTGRILNTDDITVVGRYNNVMKDLSSRTFCVPVVDKTSPVAVALVNEVHWYHPTARHSGVETTLRFVLKEAFILEGRALVKLVRKSCQRCRYIMGPVSRHNLVIAPAFYATQVDLCGPFDSFSQHHKRTTVKIWLLVFCYATTSTTNIKVMEDYTSQLFIMGFT